MIRKANDQNRKTPRPSPLVPHTVRGWIAGLAVATVASIAATVTRAATAG